MKARCCWLALLICGDLSTSVAAADKPKAPVVVGAGLKQNSNTKATIVTPPTKPGPAALPTSDKAANTAALAIVAGTGPSISGTGMMRPGSGTGAVGGSAKVSGGVIGGNGVHLKHP
jgi:hypothetical protein